jgi:hypothetical protein
LGVGDGDHRIVEAGIYVRNTTADVLALPLFDALGFACHVEYPKFWNGQILTET